jgi:hypothetical protein
MTNDETIASPLTFASSFVLRHYFVICHSSSVITL